MSDYKVGDEVLVKAVVDILLDHDGETRLRVCRSRSANDEHWAFYCAPSEIVCLASDIPPKREWVRTDERLPEVDDVGYCEVTLSDGRVLPALWLDESGFVAPHGAEKIKPKNIIAWKPFSAPYVPPAPKWDCGKCQHQPVCRFVAADKHLDRDSNCGGEHYAAKE